MWGLLAAACRLLVTARGISFPDQGSNLGHVHWEWESYYSTTREVLSLMMRATPWSHFSKSGLFCICSPETAHSVSWASERHSAGQDSVRYEQWSLCNRGPLLGAWAARGPRKVWWGWATARSHPDHPPPRAERAGQWGSGAAALEGCGPATGTVVRGPGCVPPASPPHAGLCCYLPLDEPVPRLWRCRVWSRPRTGQTEGTSTQPPSRCEAQGLHAVILPHGAEQKGGFQTLIRLSSSIGTASTRCLLAYCTFYEVPLKTITKPDQTPPEGHPQSILQGC